MALDWVGVTDWVPAKGLGSGPQTLGWGPAEFTSAGAGENPPVTEAAFWLCPGAHVQAVRSAPVLAKALPKPELGGRVSVENPNMLALESLVLGATRIGGGKNQAAKMPRRLGGCCA